MLRSLSISQEAGKFESTTFVFDMNKVFEDFVTAAFTDSMRRYGGTVRPQVGEYSLDVGARLRLKPAIGWWDGSRCLAVLDAKYKAIDDGLLRHGDAYQMLAYCTAYGLRRGYLVYAKDTGIEATTHVVRPTISPPTSLHFPTTGCARHERAAISCLLPFCCPPGSRRWPN